MEYGKRILNLRIRKGISQVEMAKLINVDSSLYCRYEKDKQTIPIRHLNAICNFFDVSLDYILGFTTVMQYDKMVKEINAIKSGERLKQFRKENKLTQDKLANILNTVHQVILSMKKV